MLNIGKSLINYFYFKKHERRGLIIAAGICVFTALVPLTFPLFHSDEQVDFSEFQREIAAFYAAEERKKAESSYENRQEVTLFNFDPNTAAEADFIALGLSPRTAKNIINYRNKGGKFRKKTDFKRIYSLSEGDYLRLEKYITLPNQQTAEYRPRKKTFDYDYTDKVIVQEFAFDPNTAAYEDLVRLGIPARTARGLIKYRNAGAVFRKKSDLKKVYNFREEDYTRLESYITLPEEIAAVEKPEKPKKTLEKPKADVRVDINTATEADWQQLRGVGPAYAAWIVKYRNRLGGFARPEQVAEVYNFPDSTYQAILPFLDSKGGNLNKLRVNILTEAELKKHPYISWKEAKRIAAYRKQHGAFTDMAAFKKMPVFKDDWFWKIEPYLSFETELLSRQ